MAERDPTREISRLMSEISTLNARILAHVYHKAWDRDELRALQDTVEEKKRRLDELRASFVLEYGPEGARQRAAGSVADGRPDAGDPSRAAPRREEPLTIHDTRLIANALYTQRPLIFQSDELPAYKRICAALVRLFSWELQEGGDFDPVEFLTHCGLSLSDAEEIAAHPGDFIRRSEELLDDE